MRTVETTGVNIEEAIEKGLKILDVGRENVIVEIIEEPNRGLLGLGSKEAVVRLTTFVPPRSEREKFTSMYAPPREETRPPSGPSPNYNTGQTPRHERSERGERGERSDRRESSPRQRSSQRGKKPFQPRSNNRRNEETKDRFEEIAGIEPQRVTEVIHDEAEIPDGVKVGRDTLSELLSQMGVTAATITIEKITDPGTPERDEKDQTPWLLHIHGKNLGMLIGRRGETLSALEYLTRLIASRDMEARAEFSVDVEDYRARRDVQLERLAQRKAEEAIRRNRTIYLEPMSPSERRIVHMSLRNHPGVYTESKGDGDHRRVTIIPRES
jgi:spoIIIJ-associated protein